MTDALLEKKQWKVLFKIIRTTHNRFVKRHFKPVASQPMTNGRKFLAGALEINNNDSGIICLVKLVFFKLYISNLNIEAIASFPELWDLKVSKDVPQLALIYRNESKNSKIGNYTLHIPHYNGVKNPIVPSYTRGNYWCRLILTDNSRIIVYANSKLEAERVVKALSKYVESKYMTKKFAHGELAENLYEENKTKPLYADYYQKGKSGGKAWRYYF